MDQPPIDIYRGAGRRLRGFPAFILTLRRVLKDEVNEHSFILHEMPHFGKRGRERIWKLETGNSGRSEGPPQEERRKRRDAKTQSRFKAEIQGLEQGRASPV
ncbi:MAG: hypothetical protein DRJ65_01075 [Acidobacteria bacterium]|nr:MAG: hypothetical protein DRJ65_01075 [Acidobacteriota bacterium]